MDLIQEMLAGDVRALARLMSLVESGQEDAAHIIKKISSRLGRAQIIGITGPPGAGKSTLISSLIEGLRKQKKKVGVLAVDPSSPISGGAVLGDRIRMTHHSLDQDVFIRSLSTGGAHGGLSFSVRVFLKLLDAFGKDIIFVETVGVGQVEVDVRNVVDTTVLVLVPEAGDSVQSLKAGIMEIADIFVVNKADREGAENLKGVLLEMTHLKKDRGSWIPPVVSCQSLMGGGIEDLWARISEHRSYLSRESQEVKMRRSRQREAEFFDILTELIRSNVKQSLQEYLHIVKEGKRDPYDMAIEAAQKFLLKK